MSTVSSKNQNLTVEEIAKNLNAAGIPPEFGPDNSRLLVKTLRALAQGRPVTETDLVQISEDLGIPFDHAEEYFRESAERNSDGNIIGAIGLSLNQDWAHKFIVNGNSLRTWCAWDTLLLPALVDAEVVVESESPVSGTPVRLKVTPERVESSYPEGAVVSIAMIDPEIHDVSSVEAIWGNFCHQVYFFSTREEADEWAEGKSNIAILTVGDAYELGRQAFSSLRQYA